MTRDEAIEKFSHTRLHMFGERRAENWIEVFETLGILNFDEPDLNEGPGQIFKIRKFMRNFHLQNFTPAQLGSALNAAGLKIVEK